MIQYDVSVIVPIYNAEKYLDQCIKSIMAQTKDNLQIILVNDGSTDESANIIKQYQTNKHVFVVEKSRSGLIDARIEGMKHAKGKYIGWVDSDDYIEPNMYERLYDTAENNQADVVYCDYAFEPGKVKGKEKWFKPYKGVKNWELIERNTQCWNKLISYAFIERIHLVELYKQCDEYANIALLLFSNNLTSIDDVLYHYRVGIQSVSGGSYIGKTVRFTKAVDCAKALPIIIQDTEYEKKFKQYFSYRVNYALIQLLVVTAINHEIKAYRHACKELHSRKFRRNPLTKIILDKNHGKIKSFILRWGIPSGYIIARAITSITF